MHDAAASGASRARATIGAFGVLCLLFAFAPSRGLSDPATGTRDTFVVGSKTFTESRVLAEMIASLVETHTDLQVERRLGLGGTLLCFEALRSGALDAYPEYTGTGWSAILGETRTPGGSLETYLRVQQAFRDRFDVEWLAPFGPNNTYALAVRRDTAQRLGLRTIDDLVRHAGELRAGFSHEFLERPDGAPGLLERYGLEFGEMRGMEHGLAYAAITAGEIDVIDAYSTDGKLLRYDLVVLVDDLGFFPPYHVAPLVRGTTLRAHPQLREVLGTLAFRLTDERMMQLNHRVEVEGLDFATVAREFLAAEGLLTAKIAKRAQPGESRDERSWWSVAVRRRSETLRLVGEHVLLTLWAVLLAVLVAIPTGVWTSRHPHARRVVLGAASLVQTIPGLALLAVLITLPGFGLGVETAIAALFVYSLLPILRNTDTALRGVDSVLIEAAHALGLSEFQILVHVRLPLSVRTILAGVRTATVIAVGLATLAAFIGAGGLGEPILTGLQLDDPGLILSGAIPAALLALVADLALALCERRLTPRGLR